MAQPINIEATLEGKLFDTLGSFWTSVFRETDKVRILTETNLRTKLVGSFNQAVQNFAGDAQLMALDRHVFVPFEQNDVIETGGQFYDHYAPVFNFGEFTDAATVYGNYRIRYWALPLKNILPVSIQGKDRLYLVGVDFFIQANRYIYFRQDPRLWSTPGGYLVVRGYLREPRSYLSYFTQTSTPGNDDLVVQYVRGLQTPQFFKLALAAVGGLGIIRRGGELLAISETKNHTGDTIYLFSDESVRVSYPHEPLQVGQVYAPLTIIGDVIQVVQAERKETAWWRQIDWRGGLTLDPLIPNARSLPLPDQWTVAYNAGQDAGSVDGSKVHAQIRLSNNFFAEQAYWERVRDNETRSGFYLNRVVGLPDEVTDVDPTTPETFDKLLAATMEGNMLNFQLGLPPDAPDVASLPSSKQVNALDVFFMGALGDVGLVIAFDQKRLVRQKEVFDFLSREMPVGGCPIIIGFVPDVVDEQDGFDSTIGVEESVSVAADVLTQVVEDEVDETVFEHESLTLLQQPPLT